ncbi:MAG: apolipoprotein N-acyltransferase [Phycisphaerae bacterium]
MNRVKTESPPTVRRASAPGGPPGGAAAPRPLRVDLGVAAGLCALTVLLFSLIFPPIEWWYLGFVCLAPWVVSVCRASRAWVVYWLSLLGGTVFFAVNCYWLQPVTGLGATALAAYLAAYWPITAWAVRTARRHHIAVVWSLPVAIVACEFLRGWVMSGFPWFFLGHAFYRQLPLIQIADVAGVYGVTFVAAMVNGCVAEAWLRYRGRAGSCGLRQFYSGVGATALVVAGALTYGAYSLGQARPEAGPRVAVIQEDFPLVSKPPYGELPEVVFARYMALAGRAAQEKPDLLVFPETVWNATQNIGFLEVEGQADESVSAHTWAFGKRCHAATAALARGDYHEVNELLATWERLLQQAARARPERRYPTQLPRLPESGPPVTVVVGAVSLDIFPQNTYPKSKRYNSALVYDPSGEQRRTRYDKVHLVPFGEYVPFRYGRFQWLYRWLNRLSPFSEGGTYEYSLTPGSEFRVFELPVGGRVYRFGTPICYEDVMAYVSRRFAWDERGEPRVDFLVNISNDGWFLHSSELPQHLAICAFRAIENRVGVARAVNTGISGFIDPNGRIYSVVERDGRAWGGGVIGYRVDHVYLDDRRSSYGRLGDWFAILCLMLTGVLWFDAVGTRWILATWRHMTRPATSQTAEGDA